MHIWVSHIRLPYKVYLMCTQACRFLPMGQLKCQKPECRHHICTLTGRTGNGLSVHTHVFFMQIGI